MSGRRVFRILNLVVLSALPVLFACTGVRDVSVGEGAGAGRGDAGVADGGVVDAGAGPSLWASAASVDITPTEYETFRDCGRDLICPGDPGYADPDGSEGDLVWNEEEEFSDCGIDRLCDADEPGYDPVKNADPAGDDYDKASNPGGTEGNGVFDTIYMGGFQGVVLIPYTGKPVAGVHDPIFAKVLALRQGDLTLVFAFFDVIGLFHKYVNAIKREVAAATGVPADNVVVTSLHNHEGPDTMGIWSPTTDLTHDNKGVNQRYILKVLNETVAAVSNALSRLEPVRLTTASAWVPSCVDRASGRLKEYPDCAEPTRTSLALDPAFDEPVLARDSRDPYVRDMRVVASRLVSAATGNTVATLVNWNNHPESLGSMNPLVSSDFPGYVRDYVAHRLGGEAIYVNGALGGMMTPLEVRAPLWNADFTPATDASGRPAFTSEESSFEKAMGIGFEVGRAAADALDAAVPLDSPGLLHAVSEVEVPVNSNYRNLFTLTEYLSPRDNAYEDPLDLSKSEEERARIVAACGQYGCVRVPLHVIGLGDVQIVTFPGEAFTEYEIGRAASNVDYAAEGFPAHDYPAIEGLRPRMCGTHNMLFALAEHELGYAVPESDVLPSGHPNYYEESVSAHPRYGDVVYGALGKMIDSACGR